MPSLAILSRFGVRPAIMPRWYAPMFHMPMSSPMMKRMLGFLSWACAAVTMNATHRATAHCCSIFSFIVCWVLLEKAGGPCEPPAVLSIRLFAFVLLHHRVDLGLDGV